MAQQLDPDILEIFVEEAEEVLEGIADEVGSAFPVSGLKSAKLGTLCRHFHTLKGGARMVGAESIGDLGRALEDLLHKIIGGNVSVADDPLQQLVEDAAALVPVMIADLQAGREHDGSYREVIRRANILLGRADTGVPAEAAAPAVAEVHTLAVEPAMETGVGTTTPVQVAGDVAAPVRHAGFEVELAEARTALAEMRTALQEASARADGLAAMAEGLQRSNDDLQARLSDLQNSNTELQGWNSGLQTRRDELQQHHDNLQKELIALRETHANKVGALAQAEGERMRLSTELATQKTRNAELVDNLNVATAELARRTGIWKKLQEGWRRLRRR